MYHLRLKGDHYQMGVKRGKIFQKCKISFPLHLDEFQLEHGKQSEKILKDFFPRGLCRNKRRERYHRRRLRHICFMDVVHGLLYV